MKICVIGAGGVGGFYGAKLARSGCDVCFVARGRHGAAIRANGLAIRSPLGDFLLERPVVVADVDEVLQADLILIAVKLWDLEPLIPKLLRLVTQGSLVVALQNGVQKDDLLQKVIPTTAILGGVTYIRASIAAPGVICHEGELQRIVFGSYSPAKRCREALSALESACRAAKIHVEVVDDIAKEIWKKFVFLVGLSGLTTVVMQPVGVIRADARCRMLLLDVLREVVTLARARNVDLSLDFAESQLAEFDRRPANMVSSMYRDRQAGHRLELPWLSGWVAEVSESLGLAAPRNRTIADILSPYQMGAPV